MQNSMKNCRNVSGMLGCWCNVSVFDLPRSICRPTKIGDRYVDLRRLVIDMSTYEDR